MPINCGLACFLADSFAARSNGMLHSQVGSSRHLGINAAAGAGTGDGDLCLLGISIECFAAHPDPLAYAGQRAGRLGWPLVAAMQKTDIKKTRKSNRATHSSPSLPAWLFRIPLSFDKAVVHQQVGIRVETFLEFVGTILLIIVRNPLEDITTTYDTQQNTVLCNWQVPVLVIDKD